MKFGLSMTSYVYSEERIGWTTHCFKSLANTNLAGIERPILKITYQPSPFDYNSHVGGLCKKFDVYSCIDPPNLNKLYLHQDSAVKMLKENPEITHAVLLFDDFLFNLEWMQQLVGLMGRHPEAIAWSVYRSAFVRYHRIIGGDGVDVIMTMHDGLGCVRRDELLTYSKEYTPESIDTHHAQIRPGERWATGRDYMQNLDTHKGIELDHAIDFVGEG